MDRLVEVSPRELRFNFEIGKKATARITLLSLMHTMPIAFKISTTAPNKYCAQPQMAVIQPQSSICVEVTMRAQERLPATFPISLEKLFVKTVMLPAGKTKLKELKNMFFQRKTKVFTDATLSIVFTGSVILRCMAGSESLDSMDSVLRDTDVNEVDLQNRSPLYMATIRGNTVMAKRLAEAGADVNLRSKTGETALLEAVCGCHLEIVKTLLSYGAKVEARDLMGRTPLHAAVLWNGLEILKVLLDAGAEANITDDLGKTPLHYAVERGYMKIIEVLLESGADKEKRSTQQLWTALHYAAAKGHLGIVELLVEHGANVGAKDSEGRSASMVAKEKGHHNVVDLLQLQPMLWKATKEGDVGTVKKCLKMGAANSLRRLRDDNGWTVLHVASFKGKVEVVKLLLEKGCMQVDEKDNEGYTALHCAAEMRHKEVVGVLLEHGADTKSLKRHKLTPLRLALLEMGLLEDKDAKSKKSQEVKPLELAMKACRMSIITDQVLSKSFVKTMSGRRTSIMPS